MLTATSFSILVALVNHVTCQEKCGPPPAFNRAKISASSDTSYDLESVVTYKCDPGFISGGVVKTSKCVLDPTTNEPVWTEQNIVCSARSCGDPGNVENAYRSGSLFIFPNHVEYICNEGHRLSGSPRRYCEASGVWSGRLPSCTAIRCGRPQDLDNGRAVYTSLVYNSELTYECNKDLQLSFNEPRICGADGEWTGAEPVCKEVECELPAKPDFGTMELVGNKVNVGSLVVYKCNPGRKLLGSGSSKCIKTGQWTFPPPRCIEPCNVPSVPNGEIGNYVEEYIRRRWRTVFKKVSEGTTLNEDENVILRCNDNYLPRAPQKLREITVTCRGGQLSPEPECISTSCPGDPPSVENADTRISSRRHEGNVWYQCHAGFTKGKIGSIKCVHGSWEGTTPTCVDTRCRLDSLNYPGLIRKEGFVFSGKSIEPSCLHGYEVTEKPNKKIYCNNGEWTGNLPPCTLAQCKTETLLSFSGLVLAGRRSLEDGESVEPACSEGFEFSNKNDSKIYCREGNWVGNLPPCSPAHCLNDPPVPENGRIKSIGAKGHGGAVEYECFQNYVMDGEGTVTCAYGKWSGSPPACKDSRCYLRNLPEKEGVDLTNNRPVQSNQKVNIKCSSGYRLRYPDVVCERGEWRMQNKLSPCQENDCRVKSIPNGEMLKKETVPTYNVFGYQTGTETTFKLADTRSIESSQAVLYVECNNPYKFQGEENEDVVEVTCRRGEWTPIPECLLPGDQNEEELSKADEEATTVLNLVYSPKIALVEHNSTDAPLDNSTLENEVDSAVAVTTINPPCSCKYGVRDDKLIAYSGKRLLKFNDEVASGSEVKFHCTEPGFFILRGRTSVMCPEDCSLHSSWFPSCDYPNRSHITIRIFTSPEEHKNVNVGIGGVITVIPGTSTLQLRCSFSAEHGASLNWQTPQSNGWMQRGENTRTQHHILNYFLSKVSRLDSGTYTCSHRSGAYRRVTIEVNDVQCSEITETNSVSISYSQNRSFGSRAAFHCFSPYQRDGPSYVTCEASGLWSDPPATCRLPTCSVSSIYDVIPDGVVPYATSENVPVGYTLKLGCDGNGLAIKGDNTATCNADGSWKVEVGVRCVPGCGSLVKKNGSELLISPEKEYYNLGDTVTFSCPVGKNLNKEVERILCFQGVWTPPDVPDCH